MKQSNKICINQEKISIEQLASLSCFGNTAQRLNISIVELIGNQLENVDAMIRLFPNLMTLNLSENSLKSVESLKNLSKL
jgi:Leucine-rich repeat (LRR) protein